jgi:hypothetical protein
MLIKLFGAMMMTRVSIWLLLTFAVTIEHAAAVAAFPLLRSRPSRPTTNLLVCAYASIKRAFFFSLSACQSCFALVMSA